MLHISNVLTILAILASLSTSHPASPQQAIITTSSSHVRPNGGQRSNNISLALFAELEELARIVDISYCVGSTGIAKPFECASRCEEFPDFELVDTFNTGPLMSDSCGYIAVDHGKDRAGRRRGGRVIVAFRGTYSIANTIVDLSTVPQEYVPYPDSPDNSTIPAQPPREEKHNSILNRIRRPSFLRTKSSASESECSPGTACKKSKLETERKPEKCNNCTVHTGFWTSWQNTRPLIIPHLTHLHQVYPDYQINLVGHSLGGAVAALAALEIEDLGWNPLVTTFGEPRVGNVGLRDYIDLRFGLDSENPGEGGAGERYRRLTHVDDPVPLLPLQEWGYRPHAGEIFISKASLQPSISDLHHCFGDEDTDCIAAAEVDEAWFNAVAVVSDVSHSIVELDLEVEPNEDNDGLMGVQRRWGIPIPARYKIWQLFFAHRDYFWRIGLCVPGGDPLDWGRNRYDFGDPSGNPDEEKEEL